MKIGYTEKEISRMYYGKWYEMFQHFKWYHNFTVKKYLFKEPEKEVSLMDLQSKMQYNKEKGQEDEIWIRKEKHFCK